jgi:protein-S-isoprenylcysteine O-methyltransferase Ste14
MDIYLIYLSGCIFGSDSAIQYQQTVDVDANDTIVIRFCDEKMEEFNMSMGLVRSIIILPGTTMVIVPAILFWISSNTPYAPQLVSPSSLLFWLAIGLAAVGIGLAVWTVRLLLDYGEGTPAPWEPTRKLVLQGPYLHVRNPMISGALLILLSEAILFSSWPILLWWFVFLIFNLFYIPLLEERTLEDRFGEAYLRYKHNVPRWLPTIRPWTGDK